MSIASNLSQISQSLPAGVRLVAVSKTHSEEAIMEAYHYGQRIFGENKVQELVGKYENLPKDIEWHFIGHLQTNKVKYLAPFVQLVHGVDSLKLLSAINNEAGKQGRKISCLLQMKIAREESKFGLSADEIRSLLASDEYKGMEWISICGLMGMATYTDDTQEVQQEFRKLYSTFRELKEVFFRDAPHFKEVSMGMSHDYLLAIQEGATLVRVGSSIFGDRDY